MFGVGQMFGVFFAGWAWVQLGRAVASQFDWDRVAIAGFTAGAGIAALFAASAQHGWMEGGELVATCLGQVASALFWLWRYGRSIDCVDTGKRLR